METNQANALYRKLVTKSWEDETFKNQLLRKPVETIESELGRPLKLNERTLIVEDQTSEDMIYFNIPKEPNFEDIELSEHQLELIAGGDGLNPKLVTNITGCEDI